MHPEAYGYVESQIKAHGPFKRVLEIGGYNVNGTVRGLFDPVNYYHAIDLRSGPGVDEVADGSLYIPDKLFDCAICCEVLEHAPNAVSIVRNAIRCVRPGGWVIFTCATFPSAPHSIDGGPLKPGEYYRNIERWEVTPPLVNCQNVNFHRRGADLYFSGQRPQRLSDG